MEKFEFVSKDGQILFKDVHGIAELVLLKVEKLFERKGKRPGKTVTTVLTVRCPVCKTYEEYVMIGLVERVWP